MNPKILIVSSSKGGVGKTTVALGISNALCFLGKKVLLCDLDFDNKCLDMFMGIEDASLYNIADVAHNTVPAEKALISNGRGLSFVPAPVGIHLSDTSKSDEYVSKESLIIALNKIIELSTFDFVVFDTPAGNSVTKTVAEAYPKAHGIVVASHQPSSRQGAENSAKTMTLCGINDIRLVITGFEPESASSDIRSGLIEIIDSSKIQLIGVVPYDRVLMLSHEKGIVAPSTCYSSKAFNNIAQRICGNRVPLFAGMKIKKRKVL